MLRYIIFVIFMINSFNFLFAEQKNGIFTNQIVRPSLYVLLGRTYIPGGNLNSYLNSQSIAENKHINEFTLEFSHGSYGPIPLVVGYQINYLELYSTSTIGNSDTGFLHSANWQLVIRSYPIATEYSQLSFLFSGGISWVELNINQSAGVTKYDLASLSIDPVFKVGLTYSSGDIYLGFAIEAGYSWNKFEWLRQHEKHNQAALDTIDLSGLYIKMGPHLKF